LQSNGVDVRTAYDVHLTGRTDAEQLVYSTDNGLVIFSHNVGDFYRMHQSVLSSRASHPGVVLAHQRQFSIGELIRRILRLHNEVSAHEMIDRLEFLSDWG